MKIDEDFYESLAGQNGMTAEEVKREIRETIEAAFKNPNDLAKTVPRKGNFPTPEELILFILNQINQLKS